MLRAFHSTWTRPFFARSPDRPYTVEPFELFGEQVPHHGGVGE